jgi:hypothetical protein
MRCRRCQSTSLATLRESQSVHGGHSYIIIWRQCRACDEVLFTYRRSSASSLPGEEDMPDQSSGAPRREPVTSRSR